MAYVFHFPPSELWEMDVRELTFWLQRAKRLKRRQ
ncbi:GpE family phage tail protein [Billgrantia gudaonensis]|nr:GpE family phage tail protein [Halomonas gudaonensis]